MESLKLHKKQRSLARSSLTRFITFLNLYEEGKSSKMELEVRLTGLDKLLEQFNEAQTQIELLIEDEGSEECFNERDTFESNFFHAKARAYEFIKSASNSGECLDNTQNSNTVLTRPRAAPIFKLPELKLPTFDGRVDDWPYFHSTFDSLINQNKELNNIERFQFLKAALTGDAAKVIQSLAVSEGNYTIAWERIIERFEDKERIILKHVQALFELPKIIKESSELIHKLIDEATNHLEGIKTLNDQISLQDRLLCFLIVNKLDNTTRREWETFRVSRTDASNNKGNNVNSDSQENTSKEISPSIPNIATNLACLQNISQILLSTVKVQVKDRTGIFHSCRALLDSGSQANLITKQFCEKVGKEIQDRMSTINGVNSCEFKINGIANCEIFSNNINYSVHLNCLVVENITKPLPTISFDPGLLEIPKNIPLADPTFYKTEPVDLLIGSQIFWDLLMIGQISLGNSLPFLQRTKLGWIVGGPLLESALQPNVTISHLSISKHDIGHQIEKFWEVENFECNNRSSEEEEFCEKHYVENLKRLENGQFMVKIPFKPNFIQLGQSYDIALKRFLSLEQKLARNSKLRQQYTEFMLEYERLGHMSEEKDDIHEGVFLPHHPVIKPSSSTTKLRVVFDASAKTSSGLSFNDVQFIGPQLQNDIFQILIRFRTYKFVLKADIAKMYRQILIHESQRDFQKILWRKNQNEPIKIYKLNTVTYGTASAPYLAIRTLKQIAKDISNSHPEESKTINNDFYVDDCITGSDSIDKLIKLRENLYRILIAYGFELRKWVSNCHKVVSSEDENARFSFMEEKTLGIKWSPSEDIISYQVDIKCSKKVTKRIILSEISQIFDPLGLLGPSVVVAKLIMQKLWQLKLDWDESIPSDLYTEWSLFKEELFLLNNMKINRYIYGEEPVEIELHGFCDASKSAYGACIYLRSMNRDESITVRLLCAKSRVAPLKTISLPKLELCGALLLAQLYASVICSLEVKVGKRYFWTDSTITLAWISGFPHKWKQFVANRVTIIQELTEQDSWRHIPTKTNPADLISRGLFPSKLLDNALWWEGPSFLKNSNETWPIFPNLSEDPNVPEQKNQGKLIILPTVINNCPLFERYSSLLRLKRITALILRFISNCRGSKTSGPILVEELERAETVLIVMIQRQNFPDEYSCLEKKKLILPTSKLLTLNPFLDKQKVMRVGGRLKNAYIDPYKKHPIILPSNHGFTELLIRFVHENSFHSGLNSTLYNIRLKYWPLSGKSTVKRMIKKCVVCSKANARPHKQLMGNLPEYRLTPTRPFIKSGIDYAGPFLVKEGYYKRARFVKAYVALFVCMVSKAVHLELVSSLSTDAFLAALNRFIARRGMVSDLYSDNGTNFTGANNELKRLSSIFEKEIRGDKVINTLHNKGISWHFIPPQSPNFGGLWENAIKRVKIALKIVLGNAHLTFEEFTTILAQIEAMINSRPLTPISDDPNDFSPLTPGHFLIGEPLNSIPYPNCKSVHENRLKRWQRLQKVQQHFWARWEREYITTLQERQKWKKTQSFGEGQLCLIKNQNSHPFQWSLGRIVKLHPGSDGLVRVVSVKTPSGILKRSISSLAPLLKE